MSLKLYNTLSQAKEDFVPLDKKEVKIYVCGPTVYDRGHLGHGRSMVAFDLVRRYLLYRGYNVNFVTNYTDIDDKMINRAAEENTTVVELAERMIKIYDRDFAALQIMDPSSRPRATDHVETMMTMVKQLISDGFAYKLDDGVYFDVTKFEQYGKLSKQKLDELQSGARIEVDSAKKNPQDFVLWKNMKPGEPSWTDEAGVLEEGRPGWHIECSAMTMDLLGETFDIHGGGADLIFPHHECEIAQSEASNKADFAKYWLHNGYVRIDGEKMSKSLNNFFTLEDIFGQHDPIVVRYALISVHYRGPIDFGSDLLHQAAQSLQRIRDFANRLASYEKDGQIDGQALVENFVKGFVDAMDDDFEISRALASLFELITEGNKLMDAGRLSVEGAGIILDELKEVDQVLGVIFVNQEEIPQQVTKLAEDRLKARADRDFALADALRDQIDANGFSIEDVADGYKLKKKLQ